VRGTPLAEVMQQVFAKLTRGMQGKIQFACSDLDDAFSRKTIEQSPRDVKLFGQIADTILNQLVTTFYYRKLGANLSEIRKVEPLHLSQVDGGWYLISKGLGSRGFAHVALPRINRLKVTSRKFERPAQFAGSEHLKQSFGIWSVAGDFSRQLVRVELRN
jgi:predicted DNA-binding transcriptional regulator YafY